MQRGHSALDLLHHTFPPYVPKKGEEYMSLRQRGHFKQILEALKEELSRDIDRTVHTLQDEATVFADPNDCASQESDIGVELRNRDREGKLIKKNRGDFRKQPPQGRATAPPHRLARRCRACMRASWGAPRRGARAFQPCPAHARSNPCGRETPRSVRECQTR